MSEDAPVMTVLGAVPASELGIVLPHEHLLIAEVSLKFPGGDPSVIDPSTARRSRENA
jgi:predicted metal-dependent phosphotriesterase family hydrolase